MWIWVPFTDGITVWANLDQADIIKMESRSIKIIFGAEVIEVNEKNMHGVDNFKKFEDQIGAHLKERQIRQ